MTGVSTSDVELVNTSSVEAQLDFRSIAQKIASGKSLYEAKDFRKHIRAIRMAKSNPQLVAGRVSGQSNQPVRAAFGSTDLAMTRRARICGGVSAGLFLPFDIWSLVKDSQGRTKKESAERLREQAQKLEMNLEVAHPDLCASEGGPNSGIPEQYTGPETCEWPSPRGNLLEGKIAK